MTNKWVDISIVLLVLVLFFGYFTIRADLLQQNPLLKKFSLIKEYVRADN